MDLNTIRLQPADTAKHFASIAQLISSQETEPTTETSLAEWYAKRQERGISLSVALSPDGEVLGFNGIYRDNLNLG
jgi:L-amino acid N-acyltransferase YncA